MREEYIQLIKKQCIKYNAVIDFVNILKNNISNIADNNIILKIENFGTKIVEMFVNKNKIEDINNFIDMYDFNMSINIDRNALKQSINNDITEYNYNLSYAQFVDMYLLYSIQWELIKKYKKMIKIRYNNTSIIKYNKNLNNNTEVYYNLYLILTDTTFIDKINNNDYNGAMKYLDKLMQNNDLRFKINKINILNKIDIDKNIIFNIYDMLFGDIIIGSIMQQNQQNNEQQIPSIYNCDEYDINLCQKNANINKLIPTTIYSESNDLNENFKNCAFTCTIWDDCMGYSISSTNGVSACKLYNQILNNNSETMIISKKN